MEPSGLLSSVEVETSETPPEASVVWLHGLGADGHDFEPTIPYLGLEASTSIRFIFPHAPVIPVTVNGGMAMRAWYDIREADLESRVDQEGLEQSTEAVARLIQQEIDRGISPSRILLAGFSQGGAVAIHLALTRPTELAGIVALSTYLPVAPKQKPSLTREVFAAHGLYDPLVRLEWGEQARDAMESSGFHVTWKTYPIQHEVSQEELGDIGLFLNSRLGS